MPILTGDISDKILRLAGSMRWYNQFLVQPKITFLQNIEAILNQTPADPTPLFSLMALLYKHPLAFRKYLPGESQTEALFKKVYLSLKNDVEDTLIRAAEILIAHNEASEENRIRIYEDLRKIPKDYLDSIKSLLDAKNPGPERTAEQNKIIGCIVKEGNGIIRDGISKYNELVRTAIRDTGIVSVSAHSVSAPIASNNSKQSAFLPQLPLSNVKYPTLNTELDKKVGTTLKTSRKNSQLPYSYSTTINGIEEKYILVNYRNTSQGSNFFSSKQVINLEDPTKNKLVKGGILAKGNAPVRIVEVIPTGNSNTASWLGVSKTLPIESYKIALEEFERIKAIDLPYLKGTFISADTNRNKVIIVSPFLAATTLFDLQQSPKPLYVSDFFVLIDQLFKWVIHLHEKGYVHGDLKPLNILVSKNRKNLYLIDFGNTKHVSEIPNSKTPYSTETYVPLECTYDPQTQSFATDLWSIGAIIKQFFNWVDGCHSEKVKYKNQTFTVMQYNWESDFRTLTSEQNNNSMYEPLFDLCNSLMNYSTTKHTIKTAKDSYQYWQKFRHVAADVFGAQTFNPKHSNTFTPAPVPAPNALIATLA